LIPTVELWAFGPFFRTTNLIQRKSGRATSYQSIRYQFVLLDELIRLRDDAIRARGVLDLFVDEIGMEMPMLSAMILYGGVRFPVTVVDLVIIEHMYELLRVMNGSATKVREVCSCYETAHLDAFRIRTNFSHYLHTTVTEPVACETSPHLTQKRLEEHKAMHDFLFGIAGTLKQFDALLIAQKHINQLSYRSLAHHIFIAGGCVTQPAKFASFQHLVFAVQLFNQFPATPFREYIGSHTPGDFFDFHGRELLKRVQAAIAAGETVTAALLGASLTYVNEWKVRFNADNPTAPQNLCQAMKEDAAFCQYFVDAIDQLTFSFVMNQLSGCPTPIIGNFPNPRTHPVEALTANLAHASAFTPFIVHSLEDAEGDADVAVILEGSPLIGFVLERADAAAHAAFDAGDHAFGIGDWIVFFIELERLMRPVLTGQVASHAILAEPDWGRKLLCAFLKGREPIYLRGWLSQALMVVRLLRAFKVPILDRIGHPINEAILAAFANLAKWFGFKPDLISDPLARSSP
jgi:hypothetical protein